MIYCLGGESEKQKMLSDEFNMKKRQIEMVCHKSFLFQTITQNINLTDLSNFNLKINSNKVEFVNGLVR